MFLHALATATPPATFSQEECLAMVRRAPDYHTRLDRRARLTLSQILRGDSGIAARQFAVSDVERLFSFSADELNAEFRRAAPLLATEALESALDRGGIDRRELDALIVCTCTGYLCPGVSSYVAEQARLADDLWLQDIVGLGCGAAIPMMRAANAILAADPRRTVACVAVEICSAAFFLDSDPGVLVSACLFGDGACATIWQGRPGEGSIRCHGYDTIHQPAQRDMIRFEQRDGKLRNLLAPSVPALAAAAVGKLYARTNSATAPRIARVISHAGGRDVLNSIEAELPQHELDDAREVLRHHGNMSSPSVLFGLEHALAAAKPSAEEDWWMVSFGAGFSAHSCRVSAA
ncbi:MAG: 3-oxoacyl-[acyl-carrier-protein] synthase III C-terminal domain-containing protein [Chthoniobacterales bacterium]